MAAISGTGRIVFLWLVVIVSVFFTDMTRSDARANHSPDGQPIRFGLTAVVVGENLRFLDQMAYYLGQKLGRPVTFVRRRSYREIMDLLANGQLDFAWICGYPYVQARDPELFSLMAVPVYRGRPLYQSYIIVHKDSPHRAVPSLKGKVFAYSDPDSNSGYLYPQYLLANQGLAPDDFFRQTFFTFSHVETIEAVAARVADGGAVDSYIWDFINATRPDLAGQTRVINKSPSFGFPPMVSRRGMDPALVHHMQRVMLDMADDPQGRRFVDGLRLDGFILTESALFDEIRTMSDRLRKLGPRLSGATPGPMPMERGVQ